MELARLTNLGILFGILILGISITAAIEYDVSFYGVDSEEAVDAGSDLQISTNLRNSADSPFTDLLLSYKLVKLSDRGVYQEGLLREDIDLAAQELTPVKEKISIEDNIPSGDYKIQIMAESSSGNPMAVVQERGIRVHNSRKISKLSIGEKGLYLALPRIEEGKNYISGYDEYSRGTQGKNAIPGLDFDIVFELVNNYDRTVNPKAEVVIKPSYSRKTVKKRLTKDLNSLSADESNLYNLTTDIDDPGTYNVNLKILASGKEILKDDVRLVIAGPGGSIPNLENSQDVYQDGEEVNMDVTLVGPADGSTNVTDAYLDLRIIKNNETVKEESKILQTLPYNPEDVNFSFEAPEDLQKYVVEAELGKGDQIYDTYSARYEPLEAEIKMNDRGLLAQEDQCIDDGICDKHDWEVGGCYDCREYDERPETAEIGTEETDEDTGNEGIHGINEIYIYILLAMFVSALLIYVVYRFVNGRGDVIEITS